MDPRAPLLLGLALALAGGALLQGLLLPEVERAVDAARALTALAAAFALGAAPRRLLPARAGERSTWVAGLACAGGAALAAALLPTLHGRLLDALLVADRAPPALSVTLVALLAAAPVALPLGRLARRALPVGDRRAPVAFAAGLALGALLGPPLAHALLGARACLALAGAAALFAAWLLAEQRVTSATPTARLAPRAVVDLALLGTAAALVLPRLPLHVDLGALGAPLWGAGLAAGAAAGLLLPARVLPRALLLPAALALPALFGEAELLRAQPPVGLLGDALRALAMGAPLGLAAGACARPAPAGPSWGLAPLLLLLPATVLPRLRPLASRPETLAAALALLALLRAALERPRPTRGALATGGLLAALALLVDLRPPGGTQPARGPGRASLDALVQRAAGDDPVPALDGRLARSWSAARARRLVHLPALLAGAPRRALLAAWDDGEAAAVLLDHGLETVDWLTTPPRAAHGLPAGVHPRPLSERAFLAAAHPPQHLVLLLPDPRVRTRLPLVATAEFHAAVRARLFPEGLLCQWFDLASVHVDELRAAVASAQTVFEHVALLVDDPRARRGLVALVAGARPLAVHPGALAERLAARPAAAADLAAVGLDAASLGALLTHDADVLRLLAPPELAVHDRRPLLGVRAGLRRLARPDTQLAGLAFLGAHQVDPLRWISVPVDARARAHDDALRLRRAFAPLMAAARQRLAADGAQRVADHADASPATFGEAEALVAALAARPDWDFAVTELLATARAWEQAGRTDPAEALLRRAVRGAPAREARLHLALADLLERRGARDEARALAAEAAARGAPRAPGGD